MTATVPWILCSAAWTSRLRSGAKLLEQLERFLDATAVDPSPDSAQLTIHEGSGGSPGPLAVEARQRLGADATHQRWASGASGDLFVARWEWQRPLDLAAPLAFYRDHEDATSATAPHRRAVGLMIAYWFEVKRPGETAAMFPGAELRSSLMVWLEARRTSLSLRYASADYTAPLALAHTDVFNRLGPKPPRCVVQRIHPATAGRKERREPIG
ncbi:MAG TPA: hypothetical protein VM734_03965 [Kofleriaceae bacterium]|jgi:hypothetical protein|nr:hypothetical protein [Kofleriaceae bacterium]